MAELRADLLILARLLLSALLGGALGWERLQRGKSAGMRTLMLVAMASALFIGLSGLVVLEAPRLSGNVRSDPIRAVQAVVIGIGFLGSGVLHRDQGGAVRGLTTSATVWATAGVGIAVGLGRYALAVGTTALMLLVLRAVRRAEGE